MTRHVTAAAALVVLVNALALAGVAWNRRGEPEAIVELTEREFTVPWFAGFHDAQEDSGLILRLNWMGASETGWLEAGKLRELGFDTRVPPDSKGAEEFYGRQAPRRAFVALEMDGAAWGEWLARQGKERAEMEAKVSRGEAGTADLERLAGSQERDRVGHSRLFAIDAALDAAELRRRHPDRARVLILPARVTIRSWNLKEDGLGGDIQELLIPQINVPLRHRALIDRGIQEARAEQERAVAEAAGRHEAPPLPPRWAVKLAFGRRLEPWIVSVRSLAD